MSYLIIYFYISYYNGIHSKGLFHFRYIITKHYLCSMWKDFPRGWITIDTIDILLSSLSCRNFYNISFIKMWMGRIKRSIYTIVSYHAWLSTFILSIHEWLKYLSTDSYPYYYYHYMLCCSLVRKHIFFHPQDNNNTHKYIQDTTKCWILSWAQRVNIVMNI